MYPRDPLTIVWVIAARRLGFRVVWDRDSFASTDGHGEIRLGMPSMLDADDSVAAAAQR